MSDSRQSNTFNVLTLVVLVTAACLASFYAVVALGFVKFFPPPTPVALAQLPTNTPTPRFTAIPTWTPTPRGTNTPVPSPTNTPGPSPTPSVTPTFPPSPTFPPTATPTPRVTRSPYAFTYEVTLRQPQYGCNWSGVAGEVVDLDDNSLSGYLVHVWGAGIDEVLVAGDNQRFNTIYGAQSAWEQYFSPNPKPMEVRVQLHDPYRADHLPVSAEIVIDFPGYCGGALGYVEFTKNH